MHWEVQLTGDPTDLQMLADTFTGGEVHVAQSEKGYVLRSSQFELLDSAAVVRESAIALVTALSASVRLVLGAREAIGVGAAVYRVRPDGKRDTTVLVGQAVSHVRAMPITVVHGTQIHRPADPILKWLPVARQDPVVAEALRLRNGAALNWDELYRLYEVIEGDVGRLMHQLGWASRDELDRFTHTATTERHAKGRTRPPRKPMSLSHARELIDRVTRAWLEWKVRHYDDGRTA